MAMVENELAAYAELASNRGRNEKCRADRAQEQLLHEREALRLRHRLRVHDENEILHSRRQAIRRFDGTTETCTFRGAHRVARHVDA